MSRTGTHPKRNTPKGRHGAKGEGRKSAPPSSVSGPEWDRDSRKRFKAAADKAEAHKATYYRRASKVRREYLDQLNLDEHARERVEGRVRVLGAASRFAKQRSESIFTEVKPPRRVKWKREKALVKVKGKARKVWRERIRYRWVGGTYRDERTGRLISGRKVRKAVRGMQRRERIKALAKVLGVSQKDAAARYRAALKRGKTRKLLADIGVVMDPEGES